MRSFYLTLTLYDQFGKEINVTNLGNHILKLAPKKLLIFTQLQFVAIKSYFRCCYFVLLLNSIQIFRAPLCSQFKVFHSAPQPVQGILMVFQNIIFIFAYNKTKISPWTFVITTVRRTFLSFITYIIKT